MFDFDPVDIVHGALLGTVEIVDIVALIPDSYEALSANHLAPEDWPGGVLYGWRLANPRRFSEPLPARGQPGLYDLPDDALIWSNG